MDADIIKFVIGYNEPRSIYYIAGELETLGRCGAEWPLATAENWKREILRLVKDRELTIDNAGLVWVPSKDKQMSLFQLD